MGPGHDDPGMFDPSGKRGKTIEKRREEHKARRGVKGAKVPAYNREDYIPEEGYDHMRDRALERGTWKSNPKKSDATTRPVSKEIRNQKGDTPMQKEFKKKYGKKATALDAVKQDIIKKHGKGAIMGNKK